MGLKGNSGYFKGTNGERKLLRMDIQLFAEFPKNKAQISHILRNEEGHLIDNIENRSLLVSISNDKNNYLGKDSNGIEWYAKTIAGKQIWVTVKNDIIQNGGMNEKPLKYIPGSGIKKRIIKRREK